MRDGSIEKQRPVQNDVKWIQPMPHSLIMQKQKSLHFFKFGDFNSVEPCRMLQDIVDFTWEPNNINFLYVLNAVNEIVLFEVGQSRMTCKAVGKITLQKPGKMLQIWGTSLLSVVNGDGTMTLLSLEPEAEDFVENS
jgi:hypothetical protein